jgi:hypothetical protein
MPDLSSFVASISSDGTNQTIGFEVRAVGSADVFSGSAVVAIGATAADINAAIRAGMIAAAQDAGLTMAPGDSLTLLASAVDLAAIA